MTNGNGQTSAFAGMFIISHAALGIGTLNFPGAFAKAGGITISIPLLIFCAIMCFLCLSICAFASYESKSVEYFQGVRYYCGPYMELFLLIMMIASNFTYDVLYMVVVGDQSNEVMVRIFGEEKFCDTWYLQRETTIVVLSTLCIFPVCLSKNIDFLKYPSILGVFAMVYLTIVIVYDYYTEDNSGAIIETEPQSFQDLFNVFPTFLLGYQCMTNGYPVFGSIRDPTLKKYTLCAVGSAFLSTLVYLPVGTFGYLKNGKEVQSNILLSYPPTNNIILVAQIAVLVSVMMSYPIIFVITRECIDKVWQLARGLNNPDYDGTKNSEVRRYSITVLWYLVTLGTAVGLPDVSVAVSFSGSLSSFFFLIFPGMFLIQTTYLPDDQQQQPTAMYSSAIEEQLDHLSNLSCSVASQLWLSGSTNRGGSGHHHHNTHHQHNPQKQAVTSIELKESSNFNQQSNNTVKYVEKTSDDRGNEIALESEQQASLRLRDSSAVARYFMRHKNKNGGVLTWFLRLSGAFLIALGVFILGQGISEAVVTINDQQASAFDC